LVQIDKIINEDENFLMILKQILKMSQLILVVLLIFEYLIYDDPIFFEKVALMDVVCHKRKVCHEFIDKWIF